MANGEQVARLQTALSGVQLTHVRLAATDWHDGAKVLRDVAAALAKCSPDIGEHFGGQTGLAAQEAFDAVHARVSERAKQMAQAGIALDRAGDAIFTADEAAKILETEEPQPPTKEQPGLDETPRDVLNREARDGQSVIDYGVEMETHERRARKIVDDMEADYDVSTEKLKEIHGDPDPVDDLPGGSGGGGGGGTGGPPTGGPGRQPDGHVHGVVHEPRPADPTVCVFPPHPTTTTILEPPVPPTPLPPGTPPLDNTPDHATTGTTSSLPGLTGAVAGGLAAGAVGGLAGGAIRSALSSAAGATPVRPIGAGGRAGAPGALGRGGPAGTRGVAASPGAPAGRGARSGTRGGPGGVGGRGAAGAGAPGGRGRGTKRDRDEKDPKRDLFLDEDGWTDDEGAAPGVID